MKVTSIGEGLEKLESWCVVSENVEWISPLENSLAVSQKVNVELPTFLQASINVVYSYSGLPLLSHFSHV